MAAKTVNYFLLLIYFASLLLDVSFAVRAYYDTNRAVAIEGIINKAEIKKYRATTKIPQLEVTTADNTQRNIYAEFGSISFRWFLQNIPQQNSRVTFYTLNDSNFFDENYAFGITVNEKCSLFKLWLDIFAAYLHSNIFIISWIIVFISVIFLSGYADVKAFNSKIIYFLVLYPLVKLSIWAFIY